MNIFICILNKFISKIKKNTYVLDTTIRSSDILCIVFDKILSLVRGNLKVIGLKEHGRVVFVGKNVKLKHKKHIRIGNSVTINDYVELNGISKNGINIGNNVTIGTHSIIRGTGSLKELGKGIKIGNNFGCGDFCFFGCSGGIEIGNNVILGQNIRFHSQNHIFNRTDIPIKEQGVISKGIKVGNDCWIGSGVVILDGVEVGNGCVIGANTLINKDIPDYSVVVGNPARIIKSRK